MANEEVLSPRKTVFVLVIVVGCFAVLWPRILSPLLVGPSRDQLKPNQFDRETGCCEVIFEPEVAVLELVNEVCSLAVGTNGKLSPQAALQCRRTVNETCGLDIAAFLKRAENVGKTTKLLLDTMKTSNSSCLKEHFGVAHPGQHSAINSWIVHDKLKQERPLTRGVGPHPALLERGRAIPAAAAPPPAPRARAPLPPHARVRISPLLAYFELDVQPPPIPGMRPPLGSPGGPIPAPRSSMGLVMPVYTICIVVFFVYTLSKMLFKRTGAGASPYSPLAPDPVFRRRVFREEYDPRPTELVVSAISGLVAEVQQQMEANDAQAQQRQNVRDGRTRSCTNGTVLQSHLGVANECREVPKESPTIQARGYIPDPIQEVKEPSPEPIIVPKCLTHEFDKRMSYFKNSKQECEEAISLKSPTVESELLTTKCPSNSDELPESLLISQEHKEQMLESPRPSVELIEPISEHVFLPESRKSAIQEREEKILKPVAEVTKLPQTEKEPIEKSKIEPNEQLTPEVEELATEVKEALLEPTEPTLCLEDQGPIAENMTPDIKELNKSPQELGIIINDIVVNLEETQKHTSVLNECKVREISLEYQDKLDQLRIHGEQEKPEQIDLILETVKSIPQKDSIPKEQSENELAPIEVIDKIKSNTDLTEAIWEPKSTLQTAEMTVITEESKYSSEELNNDSETLDSIPSKENTIIKESATSETNKQPNSELEEINDRLVNVEISEPDVETDSRGKNDSPQELVDFFKKQETSVLEDEKLENLVRIAKDLQVGKNGDVGVTEKILDDVKIQTTRDLEASVEEQKQSTQELLEEALKEDVAADSSVVKEEERENASVKVVGMELTAHSADGGAWPRAQPPGPRACVPVRAPAAPPAIVPEVPAIFLPTEIPQQTRVLVAECAEGPPPELSPLVVRGKMTLSLIQETPRTRDSPDGDLGSTAEEFTTASAATGAPQSELQVEDDEGSDEETEEEIEIEEIEEEEEVEEEGPEETVAAASSVDGDGRGRVSPRTLHDG